MEFRAENNAAVGRKELIQQPNHSYLLTPPLSVNEARRMRYVRTGGWLLLAVSAVCDLHLNLFCFCHKHRLSRIAYPVRQ